jgi:hypothetical protein
MLFDPWSKYYLTINTNYSSSPTLQHSNIPFLYHSLFLFFQLKCFLFTIKSNIEFVLNLCKINPNIYYFNINKLLSQITC